MIANKTHKKIQTFYIVLYYKNVKIREKDESIEKNNKN